jgi:hypothetical protein
LVDVSAGDSSGGDRAPGTLRVYEELGLVSFELMAKRKRVRAMLRELGVG